jgi:predicted RNA-binding protein YlxR (DUF448 family)
VGCRVRATKASLLRVVAVEGALVPDRTGRLPGRGASVHYDLQCVALAEKRRAFVRALRLAGPVDVSPVEACVRAAQQQEQHDPASASREQVHP